MDTTRSVNIRAREEALRGWESPLPHDEVSDLSDQRIDIAGKGKVIGTAELDEGRSLICDTARRTASAGR